MWNQSSPYTAGKWCGCRGSDTRHPHIKKRKLEEPKTAGGFKTYQVQNEARQRKRVDGLETNIELGRDKVLRPRSISDYRTVKMIGTEWARRS